MKLRTKIKRILAIVLAATILLSDLSTTLAYAQSMPQDEKQDVSFTTLITDTEQGGSMPYLGEGSGVKSIIPAMADFATADTTANFVVPAKVRKLAKENYRPNEEIAVVIENGVEHEYTTELIDAIGNKVAVDTDEVKTGAAKVLLLEQPSSFRPGKYTLRITDETGATSEQDFRWGVLAINPDKSVYSPNETANLAIGILDEGGNMVCDAQAELQITDPKGKMTSLSTDNGKIIINPECKSHDFTLKPDYETNYQVGGAGTYKMLLKAQTKNGAYSISDAFEVRNDVPFSVKRVTATRIYPPNVYPVTMEIIANQDFEGTVTETVPASFKIARPGQEIKSDADKVEEMIKMQGGEEVAGASTSASPVPQAAEQVLGLNDTASVLGYSTRNNIQESLGGPQVLGASIPGLQMPFNGLFPISQEFGQSLVTDSHDHDLYASFGMHGHDGIDFAMPEGTQILAVDSGKVLLAGDGDYGITVVIEHSWGRSYYGHLRGVDVKEGQEVTRGAAIAQSGNTGISTGPHLHFGIKPKNPDAENGYYGKVDPAYYLGMKQSAGQVLGVATKVDAQLASVATGQSNETAPQFNSSNTDVQVLTWKISVKKGEKISIGYNYLAPRISPQFYTLGPAVFTDTQGNDVFHETRKWQIASDALEYKFKRGSFTKTPSTNCATPCTQTVSGIGFKPKAVIFEWTNNTSEVFSANNFSGIGFATSSTEERALSYWSEDASASNDTGKIHSATKTIVIQTTNGAVDSQAEFVSFDSDGFTLNWTSNSTGAYIIHYTAIGGADVSNAKVGSFTLATSGATQSFTDPGFQPDFLMFLSNGSEATDLNSPHASISAGFASSPAKEGAVATLSRDATDPMDSCRVQRTDASIVLLTATATCATTSTDAVADLASFDATGFTLNVTDTPARNTPIYYLALKGGQYDVGSFTQPTTAGDQSVYTGFRPSGLMTLAASTSALTTIQTTGGALSTGGASRGDTTWCNDISGVQCTTSWTARKKITFNNSASTETLTNFPVMVKLSSASANIDFNKTQFNGQDIRFVDPSDPNTVLSHEIESWNEPGGEAIVWVKVPQIDARSTTDSIWMYYGNPTASDGQDTSGVWTSYTGVWHLNQTVNDNTAGMLDSVSGMDATPKNLQDGGGGSTGFTAKIGKGVDLAGDDDWLQLNSSTFGLVQGKSAVTVTGWSRMDSTSGVNALINWNINGSCAGQSRVALQVDGGLGAQDNLHAQIRAPDSAGGVSSSDNDTADISTGTWYYMAGVFDVPNDNLKTYLNGVQKVSSSHSFTASTLDNTPAGCGAMGADDDGASEFMNGSLDEIRIADGVLTDEWLEAEYNNQNNTLNTYSSEETQAGGTTVYSQGSVWGDDVDGFATSNNATSSRTDTVIQFGTSPSSGNSRTVAKASLQSLDSTGFTINWSEADSTARNVLYWAVGSVTAAQEDYRWYKNTDALTPTTALEDENQSTILAKSKPYARLRTNIGTGGNGLNASTQGYKLQYAANQAEASVGGTSDWCNDTTGVTCTAPIAPGGEVPADTPSDWCNDTIGVTCTSDWSSRRKITFNNASSSAALTNFPVLVKLDSTRINYSKTQNNGEDLRFIDPSDPNTVLNHEIESWNESGTSYVWVKVPSIDGRSTTDSIWMYYGNSAVGSPATQLGDSTHATGVWDSNYRGVWHLKEDPSITNCPTTKEVCDSTSNANNGDMTGSMTSGDQVTGKVNGSLDFDGADDTINAGSAASVDNLAAITISAWINPRTMGESDLGRIIEKNAGTDLGWYFYMDNVAGAIDFEVDYGSNTLQRWGNPSAGPKVDFNSWNHVSVTWDGSSNASNVHIYINGQEEHYATSTNGSGGRDDDSAQSVRIGSNGAGTRTFDGQIDAVRLSNTVRSIEWIRAEYLAESDQFNTYGSEFSLAETKQSSTGWQYRKKITFNNASSSAALTDFPVLVKLDSTRIDYTKTQDDGDDLRFVDPSDNTTVLSHEIESWNENGTSYVWVKVPSLAAGTEDYIWMYYGNAGASNGENTTGVWKTNYSAVFHLAESNFTPGTVNCGVSYEVCDSTSNARHGDTAGMDSSSDVQGKINGAAYFDGSNDDTNHGNVLDFGNVDFSWSAWVNSTDTTYDVVMAKWSGPGNEPSYQISVNESGHANQASCAVYSGGVQNFAYSTSPFNDGKWHHIQCVRSGATMRLYFDGVAQGIDSSSSGSVSNTANFTIGDNDTSTDEYIGSIDEVQVYSDDWTLNEIQANYLTQSDQMNSFGEEQPYAISGTNTVGWTDVADVWCSASTNCNTSWAYRKRITINNQSSATALTNFPVLVKLDSTRIDYTKTQDDGDDLRFVDPSNPSAVLDYEIEKWNESGESFVWVEVPQLDANSTSDSIWMYYGNASASNGENITGTWSNGYVAVYHFNETSGQHQDSTSNANNATTTTVTQQGANIGKIDGASEFDGTDDYVRGNDSASLGGMSSLTVETWFKPDATPGSNEILSYKNDTGAEAFAWQLLYIPSGNAYFEVNTSGTNGNTESGTVTVNAWNHYAGVYENGQTLKSYLNGVNNTSYADTPSGSIIDANSHFNIGGFGGSSAFDGVLDEQRISNVARSADWMKMTYLTGSDSVNTFGGEETQTSAVWRFKDNSSVTNGMTINTTGLLSTSATGDQMSYQESNITPLNPTAIAVGEKREFDFALDASLASNRRTYYFRIVAADGTPLTSYTRYPSITVGVPNQKVMRGGKFFNYKQSQPFTF